MLFSNREGLKKVHYLLHLNHFKIYMKEKIPILSKSVGGLRQQFSLSENIQIGLYARDFMRNYPQSIFAGSTVPADKVPDVKFQPHGYLFLASEAGYEILKQNHDTQEQ